MYYKIENKKCDVYRKLHALRSKEIQFEKDNVTAIEGITGLTFSTFVGRQGQQNFSRITTYNAFKFNEIDKIDMTIWVSSKDHPECYTTNRKTKAGKAMADSLNKALKSSNYHLVFEILKLEDLRKFTFPYVEIADNETILIFLGDGHEPTDKNVVEITKTEFSKTLKP